MYGPRTRRGRRDLSHRSASDPALSHANEEAMHHLASLKVRQLQVNALCDYLGALSCFEADLAAATSDVSTKTLKSSESFVPLKAQGVIKQDDSLQHNLAEIAQRADQRLSQIQAFAAREKAAREEKQRQEAERRRIEQARQEAKAQEHRAAEVRAAEQKAAESKAAAAKLQAATPPAKAVRADVGPPPSSAQAELAVAAATRAEVTATQTNASSHARAVDARHHPAAAPIPDWPALQAEFGPLEAAVKARAPSGAEAKKVFLDIKREILPKVQAIVPAISVCRRVVGELCEVLERHKGGDPLHSFHAMLCLAMKFVPVGATGDVGEHLVYPYAAVGVHVGIAVPEFLRVWAYCMYGHCPMVIPATPRGPEDDASLGLKAGEPRDTWLTRVGLFVRQYAAILQTKVTPALLPDGVDARYGSTLPSNPLGLAHAWRWLGTVLNLPPAVLTAHRSAWTTAVAHFTPRVGYALLTHYGPQAGKLLALLETQFIPLMRSGAEEGGPADALAVRVGLQTLSDFFAQYHAHALLPPEGARLSATATGQAGADPGSRAAPFR